MLHKRFILRQITRQDQQVTVFILCVMLSIVTLVAVDGFSRSIRSAFLNDARALHAADIIVRSHTPLSAPIQERVRKLTAEGRVESSRVYEFYSVVRTAVDDNSLLAAIKIAGPGYPFYGQVLLASGRSFGEVLQSGAIIVEQTLLDRLGISVGDELQIGKAVLTIEDVVLQEPDRPVNFLSFGPRVFISEPDKDRLDLMKAGSRVHYRMLLKVLGSRNTGQTPHPQMPDHHASVMTDEIARDLAVLAAASESTGQERVETANNARSRVKRFFDNFLFFLALIAILTLLLSGIAIRSAVSALLKEKESSIAVIRALGGNRRFIYINFIIVIMVFGAIGTLLGLFFGFLLQTALPVMFGHLLPANLQLTFSWAAMLEGSVLGVGVVGLFAFLPLNRAGEIKPGSVFRKAPNTHSKGWPYLLSLVLIVAFFIGIVFWQLKDIRIGLRFIAAIFALSAFVALLTQAILLAFKRWQPRSLALRQAIRGLFRPGNATRSTIITLASSLAVIFAIYLVEQNLDAAFVRSYPADAPNLFFIDIQPDQVAGVKEALGESPRFYPIIRSQLVSVNDWKVDRRLERQRRGDNLARPFNLTYRDDLLEDEVLTRGSTLFREEFDGLQVSVLDSVVEMKSMAIGDQLEFKVQGIPVKATISSIRSRTHESVKPFFYFVFPENSIIKTAPQTIFTAVRVPPDQLGRVQTRIVSRFPNVSVINVTQTLVVFSGIIHRLTGIIRFFTAFSVLAGILIIVSSVFATRFARIQEAVYFKILGARNRFVFKVLALENIMIGLVSAVMAIGISQTGSWLVCTRYFNITYQLRPVASLAMVIGTVILVMTVGGLAARPVLKKRPARFLREQTEE